ncbi:hypothetical protein, partial [Cupriavidus sp. IDO]|uniref:hypothetical protein n=1 Tax=Cupriavidus sp. IDO TaxID=1539142 RepID=UPI001EE73FA7
RSARQAVQLCPEANTRTKTPARYDKTPARRARKRFLPPFWRRQKGGRRLRRRNSSASKSQIPRSSEEPINFPNPQLQAISRASHKDAAALYARLGHVPPNGDYLMPEPLVHQAARR